MKPMGRVRRTMLVACMVVATAAFAAEPSRESDQDATRDEAPYPASRLVKGLALDWSTHRRAAQGSDNFQLTWADDDCLYGAWGDGGGFGGTNSQGRVGLGVARIEGDAELFRGFNVWGGADPENDATFGGKSWGMLSVDGELLMWVVPDVPQGDTHRNHYAYVELARSRDHGASWQKAPWRFLQSEQLTIPTFLNAGRDCADVPDAWDGYLYSYFIRPESTTMRHQGPGAVGLIVHRPGVLYLARVRPIEAFVGKEHYEFFCGLDDRGEPTWGGLEQKRPVFEDAAGVGWCVSASYCPGLDRIVLCTEHGVSHEGQLGFFESPTPWGPWSTIAYHTPRQPFGAVRPGSDLPWANNVFFASFPTKWYHGTEFALCFTGSGGGKDNDSLNVVRGSFLWR